MNEHERLAKICLLVLYSVAFFTPYQTTLKFESESNEIVNVIQNAIWQLVFLFQSTVVFSLQNYPKPPPVGTRVRRGPHWKWGDQDGNGPGTIVKVGGTAGQCHTVIALYRVS